METSTPQKVSAGKTSAWRRGKVFWDKFYLLSDEALLSYYHSTRNLRAFRHLYRRHKDILYRYCVQMNSARTNLVLEELWQGILEKPPELCGRLLRSWLFIRLNKLLNNYADDFQQVEDKPQNEAEDCKLLHAIRQLPRIQRNIFLLHVECRIPLATVADIEKISLARCREHYHSGKEQLEQIVHGTQRKPWPVKEVAV